MRYIKTIFLSFAILLTGMHLQASGNVDNWLNQGATSEKPAIEKPANNVTHTDTLSPKQNMIRRLEDPAFDIRINNTPMPLWHDIKSIYPRRTIPGFNLAVLRGKDFE